MEHLFIINPAAGKADGTRAFTEKVRQCFQRLDEPYTIAVTQYPGHGALLVRQAAQKTREQLRVYACGGDGTLNEVVNGAAGFSHVAVTHYPGGSGNDFIRIFNHPQAFEDLSLLLDCAEAQFDLICCNGRYGLNVCSLGVDARIGTAIGRYKRLPFVSGSGAYVLSTVVEVLKGVHEPYRIVLNGQVLNGEKTMIYMTNGRYYGGGFHPVPDANPADGLLDVLLVAPVSRLKVAAVVGKYKNGLYREYPELITHYRCDRVEIHCGREAEINLDGELLRGRDVTVTVAPEKIRFFYPKALTWQLPQADTAGPVLAGSAQPLTGK